MITAEEKIKTMECERVSYMAGYKDALQVVFLFFVTVSIIKFIWWG